MTTFKDGPAAGKKLTTRRAPYYLRVTSHPINGVDALDQIGDTAKDDEILTAYRIVGTPGYVHLNTGRKPGGGSSPIATYEMIHPQPIDAEMRTNAAWKTWCEANKPEGFGQ